MRGTKITWPGLPPTAPRIETDASYKIRAAAAGDPQFAEEAMDFDPKHEQELNHLSAPLLGSLQAQIEENYRDKHPVPAEVALFIHRPYA